MCNSPKVYKMSTCLCCVLLLLSVFRIGGTIVHGLKECMLCSLKFGKCENSNFFHENQTVQIFYLCGLQSHIQFSTFHFLQFLFSDIFLFYIYFKQRLNREGLDLAVRLQNYLLWLITLLFWQLGQGQVIRLKTWKKEQSKAETFFLTQTVGEVETNFTDQPMLACRMPC